MEPPRINRGWQLGVLACRSSLTNSIAPTFDVPTILQEARAIVFSAWSLWCTSHKQLEVAELW